MYQIAVLVSGNGSNLQAIIDACASGELNCHISIVIADRECYALERARQAGIPAVTLSRKEYRQDLSAAINQQLPADCQLIVLAGFLSILSPSFVNQWQGKMINLHPSLLPRHGGPGMWGAYVHQAVLAGGDTETGCSVHWVTAEVDQGEVLAQARVTVNANDDVACLQKKVQQLEGPLLLSVIKQLVG